MGALLGLQLGSFNIHFVLLILMGRENSVSIRGVMTSPAPGKSFLAV